jgi:hypothetical protein
MAKIYSLIFAHYLTINIDTAGYNYLRTDFDVRIRHRFMLCFIVLEDVGVPNFLSKLFQFLFSKEYFFTLNFRAILRNLASRGSTY